MCGHLFEILFDIELIPVSDQSYRPVVALAESFHAGNQFDLTGFFTLPGKMYDATAREYRLAEVACLLTFMQETQRVKDGALARGVGANEQVQITDGDLLVAQAPVGLGGECR